MSASIAAAPIKSRIERRLGVIPYQAGTTQMLRLDADGLLAALRLRLRFRVTNGASAAVGARAFALAAILRRVELLVNSARTLISTSGVHLVARSQLETGVRPFGMDATVVLTGSAVTDYDVVIPVMLSLPRSVAPWDTGLDMRRVQQAVLQVAWGDASDIYVTPNGAVVSNVQLDVEGLFKHNANGAGIMARELVQIAQDVSATNADLGVMLDRGPYFLRSLNILTVSDGLLINTMLDNGNIAVRSGSFPFVDRQGASVRGDQSAVYGMALAERVNGVYRVEFSLFGENATNINAAALSADLFARFNVTRIGTVDQLLIGIERLAAHP
jgi:hypothetical protein